MDERNYSRGDWVTLTEPYFLSGRRAVVLEARVKLATVVYVDSYREVNRRDVPIESLRLGHDSRGGGWDAVESSFDDLKLEHARELMDYALTRRLIGQSEALTLIKEYSVELTKAKEGRAHEKISRDRELLTEWLDRQG